MKFAIVLLGLFALAAAYPEERGIIQNVESVVTNAISKAHADMDSIASLVTGLATNAKGQIAGLISGAKGQITSKIGQLESTISGLIGRGGTLAACAQKNLGELSAFKGTIGKNVESCAGDVVDTVGSFEGSVFAEISSMKGAISDLVTIVQECSANALEAVVCAVTKVKQVETLVQQIVSQASGAVEGVRGKLSGVIGKVQACSQQVLGEATITINKFTTAVKQCA